MWKLAVAVAGALLSTSGVARAQANRWVDIGMSEDARMQYDSATIKRVGPRVSVWRRGRFPTPRVLAGDTVDELYALIEFDCERRTMAYIELAGRLRGASVYSQPGSNAMRPVAPDSIAEDLMFAVCRTGSQTVA